MTNSKHTPTPWKHALAVVCNAPSVYVITDGKWGAPTIAQVVDETRAARIVACVNACEGIADPSVVPELVAALESIVSYPDLDSDRPVSGADLVDWLCAELAHFKRVLAKAKNGGK